MADADYSSLLDWGMTGVGPQTAGRIWAHAMINDMPDGPDYSDTRTAIITGAKHIFGSGSAQANATRNAYAGINVGSLASNYPASRPLVVSAEPNDSAAQAQFLSKPSNAGKPAGCPDKLAVFGSGGDDDFFNIQVPAGKTVTFKLSAIGFADQGLGVIDTFNGQSKSMNVPKFTSPVMSFATTGTAGTTHIVRIRVSSAGSLGIYLLNIDWEP